MKKFVSPRQPVRKINLNSQFNQNKIKINLASDL